MTGIEAFAEMQEEEIFTQICIGFLRIWEYILKLGGTGRNTWKGARAGSEDQLNGTGMKLFKIKGVALSGMCTRMTTVNMVETASKATADILIIRPTPAYIPSGRAAGCNMARWNQIMDLVTI